MTIAQDPTFNYEDLGYNNRLQATNSLASKNENIIDNNQLDSNYQDGVINNSKIQTITANKINAGTISTNVAYAGTLNFNQINGGTATLGGTVNGNGVLIIKGSTNQNLLTFDNQGLKVIDRSLTIGTVSDGIGGISPAGLIYFVDGTPGLLSIDCLDKDMRLETDSGNIRLYCDTNAKVDIHYGTTGVIFRSSSGTTAILDNDGNLKIKGTITQNTIF